MSILVEWLGHACFRITSSAGKSILIDPFDDKVGYRIPDYTCDILLITHDHFDHAAVQFVPGDFKVIRKEGKFEEYGIPITSKSYSHDTSQGSKRGKVLAFRFVIDGITLAHVGDLGEVPSPADLNFLRGVQCLMIPVGGYYTIGAAEATKIVEHLKPAYVFPMHYKTRVVSLPIGNVEDFTAGKSDVQRIGDTRFTIEPGKLPSRTNIIVLDFI